MNNIKEYLHSFISLIYPNLCIGCYEDTPLKGDHFCIQCLDRLPFTTHFDFEDNDFREKFYGRVHLEFGAALLNFYQENIVQEMLHRLKYKRKKVVGEVLGELLSNELTSCPFFEQPDLVIPIPIHFKKRHRRGYNQAEIIGQVIAKNIHHPNS